MSKKIYVLVAKGNYFCFDGIGYIMCKKAFTSKDSAEKEMPIFLEKAKEDHGGLFELEPSTIQVFMQELELI